MLRLDHEFTIDRPLSEVWPVLTDLRSIADALPGAHIEDVVSDGTYLGALKVKLGAFTATFRGDARHTRLDDVGHSFELEASGRSPQGDAGLQMSGVATDEGGVTQVRLTSSVRLTGRLAQFGGSMAGEVARPMLDTFVANFTDGFTRAAAETAESPSSAGATPADNVRPEPPRWQGRSAETLDLGASLLPGPAKYLPLVGAAILGALAGVAISRRGRYARPIVVLLTGAEGLTPR